MHRHERRDESRKRNMMEVDGVLKTTRKLVDQVCVESLKCVS